MLLLGLLKKIIKIVIKRETHSFLLLSILSWKLFTFFTWLYVKIHTHSNPYFSYIFVIQALIND